MSNAAAVTVEATGETVGEAKWAALHELELLVPGLDRDSVEFQVISEGERGLLGVGFTPAHVIASASVQGGTTDTDSSAAAQTSREFVQRVAAAIGASVTAATTERDGVVTVTCTGADLGLFIGKHGQTIDAIQYLANAMARSQGDQQAVVVDAAGYRARRTAALETIAKRTAQRVAATGRRVELDPMTPVERKIVHEALKGDPGVETSSEGSEPNRYVVVLPRLASG